MGLLSTDPDQFDIYGTKFKWGPFHQSPEQLNHYIHTYDTVAAEALDALDEIVPPAAIAPRKDIQQAVEVEGKKHRDLFNLVKEHAKTDKRVGRLWDEVNTVPEWVDWKQIDRGQKVFWRYGGASITALTFLSLLGGMGSGRTVETLDRTGGFGAKAVRRRLLETTQHTLGVHKDLEAIKPGGIEGFESSVRVRLLHASVRQRVLKLAREKPEYYDLKNYGVPVNDLDCIGTIGTFSSTVIWLGLPRQGIFLREQEILDYLALWRYVAYLMGTPYDWLATPETAKAMMESLLVSEVKPTKKSGTLANNIITGFEGQAPTHASRGFMNAVTYWLNGKDLSRELNIEEPTLYYKTLVLGQCLFFMVSGYINRLIPALDERNLARKVLYDLLVHNKKRGALGYRTKFNFKWVPDLQSTTTPLGEPVPGQAQKSGIRQNGVERTAFATLVFTGVVLGLAVWGVWSGFHAVSSLARGGSPDSAFVNIAAPIWEFAKQVKA
ncbi:hypothetical protein PFICI_09314 [Pestalotiopsis fici W106-1]|uniref:ER-bound oxygenase mpaB/mpaB'/Rubber oxygenase catalytic domain-containing protein n=1 Tax=Pestalotiopsis fici (strain W106-1 / CGMCC3.15140) TaxID=1229662 RepID=W3X2T7_PESFW|nr:uncharacterized protein PFICI_09314 [Pestalotiopsis fici W106-1]ETS79461.1 hypothetical protein PFICI_09314 [Pestalotiopsis fici W106-1]